MPGPVQSVASVAAIATLIRQAFASKAGVPAKSTATRKTREGASRRSSQQSDSLPDIIAARVEELSPDASDYRTRLLRLVIEAALLHEFGSKLINAPKFQAMVDQVLQDIEASPLMTRDVNDVVDGLIKGRNTAI